MLVSLSFNGRIVNDKREGTMENISMAQIIHNTLLMGGIYHRGFIVRVRTSNKSNHANHLPAAETYARRRLAAHKSEMHCEINNHNRVVSRELWASER